MSTAMQKLIGVVFLGVALAGAGWAMGQFMPFTGMAQIAAPFSPIRNETAMAYAAIGALVGIIGGLCVKPLGSGKQE